MNSVFSKISLIILSLVILPSYAKNLDHPTTCPPTDMIRENAAKIEKVSDNGYWYSASTSQPPIFHEDHMWDIQMDVKMTNTSPDQALKIAQNSAAHVLFKSKGPYGGWPGRYTLCDYWPNKVIAITEEK